MANFKKIIERYHEGQSMTSSFTPTKGREASRDCLKKVEKLEEIKSHLQDKVSRLYGMLGGDDNELVIREKKCDQNAARLLAAIDQLKLKKAEVEQLIEKAYDKVREAEVREKSLLETIDKLERENKRLEKSFLHEQRLKLKLEHQLRQVNSDERSSSDIDRLPLNLEGNFEEYSAHTDSATLTYIDSYKDQVKDKPVYDKSQSLNDKVDFLAEEYTRIRKCLERLSQPTSNIYSSPQKPFDEIEEFLKG